MTVDLACGARPCIDMAAQAGGNWMLAEPEDDACGNPLFLVFMRYTHVNPDRHLLDCRPGVTAVQSH